MTRLLLVSALVLAACPPPVFGRDAGFPEDAGVAPTADAGAYLDGGSDELDAGAPDSGRGSDGGILRLDWRTVRGAAYPVAPVGPFFGSLSSLYALTGSGFVTQTSCDPTGARCDYAWHDDAGVVTVVRAEQVAFNGSPVSGDAALMVVQDAPRFEACVSGTTTYTVSVGRVRLLDVATSAERWFLPDFRTNLFFEPAFSLYDRWFTTWPIAPLECQPLEQWTRSRSAPFDRAADESSTFFLEQELPDGRMMSNRGADFGLSNPTVAGSFSALSAEPISWFRTLGYVHSVMNSPIRRIHSEALAGGRSTWELPWTDNDFVHAFASGRWVVACTPFNAQGVRRCFVHDAAGEFPDRLVLVQSAMPRYLHIAGASDLLVYFAQTGFPERMNLRTGEVGALSAQAGELSTVASESAVLVRDGRSAWLVERESETLLASDVQYVVAVDGVGLRDDLPQRALVVLVRQSASGGQQLLTAYHHGQRRLVDLTDALYVRAEFRTPLTAHDTCGIPWVTRAAGPASDSTRQLGRYLFFGELDTAVSPPEVELWMLPVDLSAPPRSLGRFAVTECPAPKVSHDGATVGYVKPLLGGLFEVWRGALAP